jgi:hypothetical protein
VSASSRLVGALLCALAGWSGLGGAEPIHGGPRALISHRYEPLDDCPAVVDRHKRLMWQRCALGQSWDGRTCVGRPHKFEWTSAAAHREVHCGFADWHLPELADLEDLVAEGTIPAIDEAVFPNTPPSSFWSASVSTANGAEAWYVSFGRGGAQHVFKDARFHVRLVRELR